MAKPPRRSIEHAPADLIDDDAIVDRECQWEQFLRT